MPMRLNWMLVPTNVANWSAVSGVLLNGLIAPMFTWCWRAPTSTFVPIWQMPQVLSRP